MQLQEWNWIVALRRFLHGSGGMFFVFPREETSATAKMHLWALTFSFHTRNMATPYIKMDKEEKGTATEQSINPTHYPSRSAK